MVIKTRKRLGILLSCCLLILGTIPSAFGSGSIADDFKKYMDEVANNPSDKWLMDCMEFSDVVATDFNGITTALINADLNDDLEGLSQYADKIVVDSQKAIDLSNSYEVSSTIQPIKDKYNLAMEQARQGGIYIKKGIEENKIGNKEGAKSNFNMGADYLISYKQNMAGVHILVQQYIGMSSHAGDHILEGGSGGSYTYKHDNYPI